jgi:hypothetical protein
MPNTIDILDEIVGARQNLSRACSHLNTLSSGNEKVTRSDATAALMLQRDVEKILAAVQAWQNKLERW